MKTSAEARTCIKLQSQEIDSFKQNFLAR